MTARVVVYTRQGCHLCAEAERMVRRVVDDATLVTLVDVDGDPALRDRYTVRVPVVAVDGVEVAELAVDETALRLALAQAGLGSLR